MKRCMQGSLVALAAIGTVLVSVPHAGAKASTTHRAPFTRATARPWARVGRAVAVGGPVTFPSPGALVVSQTFANATTPANVFPYIDQACLTAGTTAQQGSVPPCGSLAPQDQPGSGVLENTNTQGYTDSWVIYGTPVSTLLGVQVSFTIFSFGGNGADGQLLFFTDASKGLPTNIGQNGGELGYTSGGSGGPPGLANAYVGMGFDEYGTFSEDNVPVGLNGGPGHLAETIAVRGAASTGYYYLGGAVNAEGQPASLPFNWNSTSQNRPASGPTVFVTLSPTGYLTCAVDIHDGNGFITYYAQSIVGVQGQPAVPPSVYVGVTGSTGGADDRHQIDDLYVWQG